MEIILIIIYSVSMLFVLAFSLVQLHLALIYRSGNKKEAFPSANQKVGEETPLVTIQLPVYNERYVVGRLLDAIARLDWPKDRMQIQVLDDSTDETSRVIQLKLLEEKFQELDVTHIHRKNREGYKAGALQNGLKTAIGSYIAIFDADFVPKASFLKDTMREFVDPQIGMVQTRWDHLNKDFSLLTKLQAFGLNAHFRVEQSGRSKAGSFINFNGTAGIWRRKCITDAGGWHQDTLTEDLDLSYRAQMIGWKFRYLENVQSPAELPIIMSAVKSQQFRWTKGGAETARKNLVNVLKTRLNFTNKVHAFFHLTNNANFLLLLIASLVSIPLVLVKKRHMEYSWFFDLGSIFVVGFIAIAYFYWMANRKEESNSYFIKYFPLFIMFSLGFTFNNSLAVIEGWLGIKTPFERTPKFNIVGDSGGWKENIYFRQKITWMTLMEGMLSLYFFAGIVVGIVVQDYGLILFHLLLATGYAGIFYYSLKNR
jgi:cellulose synthase/poly-beta-1,6-N-acetylglucosamine synthase-like glycosyltransferase